MTTLEEWNRLSAADAIAPVLACCGSSSFSAEIVAQRPFATLEALLVAADSVWWSLEESDWLEAFACHPRIGESPANTSHQFSAWSAQEQSKVQSATTLVLQSIAEKNSQYESRHGFLYIVCASGRSAGELVSILDRRIHNETRVEIREAAEQQRQITALRLRKWLAQ